MTMMIMDNALIVTMNSLSSGLVMSLGESDDAGC